MSLLRCAFSIVVPENADDIPEIQSAVTGNMKMKKAIIIILFLAVLMIAALHVFPAFESWMHQLTGWY